MDELSFPDSIRYSADTQHGYLLRRAEKHRRLAETSTHARAKAVHLELSQLYAERAAALIVVSH